MRYYGWYSDRSRGDRKGSGGRTSEGETDSLGQLDSDQDHFDPEYTKAARSAWAELIKKVYAVDPLKCPYCGGEMRFLAVIEEEPVIDVSCAIYRCGPHHHHCEHHRLRRIGRIIAKSHSLTIQCLMSPEVFPQPGRVGCCLRSPVWVENSR